MKLILESWRKYLTEEQETPITKLRVFDFDDTLAHARDRDGRALAKIKVINTKTGEIRTLDSQKEFEAYEETEGEELDFSEYKDVPEDTQPIEKILSILENMVNHPDKDRKVMIITARMSEAVPEIKEFLEKLAINTSEIEIIGTGGKDKSPYIKKELENFPTVDSFIMFDDSEKNLTDVREMMEEDFPNIKVELRQPKIEDGEVRVPVFRD